MSEMVSIYSPADEEICEKEYLLVQENNEEEATFSTIVKKDDILQNYLKDIGRIRLLKTEEERELGKAIKECRGKKADIAKKKKSEAKRS